eukprot:986218-Amphidinium_carterae.2
MEGSVCIANIDRLTNVNRSQRKMNWVPSGCYKAAASDFVFLQTAVKTSKKAEDASKSKVLSHCASKTTRDLVTTNHSNKGANMPSTLFQMRICLSIQQFEV